MGGVEVSRDGGAHQETVRVLFDKMISNHCGGINVPVRRKNVCKCAHRCTLNFM